MPQIIIVEKSITIQASTAKIYKALITATELTRWRADRAESDARVGGAVVNVRGDHEAHGVYKRLVPNREVAIHWDRHDHILPEDLTVFRLEKTAKGTKVWVDDFALPEEVDRVGAEWEQQLKQLKKVYQSSSPKPKPAKKIIKRKPSIKAKAPRKPVKATRKKK